MRSAKLAPTAKTSQLLIVAVALAAITLGTSVRSQAQTESVIYSFPGGTAGSTPYAGVIFDAAGNLYSTAYLTGLKGYGAVFELKPVTGGGWQAKSLHAFTGTTDGANPTSNLIFDASGNLYGTANYGGDISATGCVPVGCGVVFELSPAANGWHETVLHTFFKNTNDGAGPNNDLVMDASGNLYGTTGAGGVNQQGTAFKLSRVSGGGWHYAVIHAFAYGKDGSAPFGGMILDSAGNLYGTTTYGGNPNSCVQKNQGGCGTVYELSPTSGGGWHEKVLYTFNATDGATPVASLISDAAGNLYGTTGTGGKLTNCYNGGGLYGCGVVFELSPTSGGRWQETVLYAFTGGADGAYPDARLILDASGNLYGTATTGGNLNGCDAQYTSGCGVVFKLSPNSGGGWQETVLHAFTNNPDGALPGGSLIFDVLGNLYGTTSTGGPHGNGTVFEITP
jgi:uncharacterized repeat protein (TIGR03803 family)